MYRTLAHRLREHAVQRARRARRQAMLLIPAIAGVIVVYQQRKELFGVDVPVRVAAVVALVILGWALARDLGRALWPTLERRLDPGTAGVVGFLIRLVTLAFVVLVALRFAGLTPRTLAVGGAITAVVLGLAAQQTLGNLFAGIILISARPFRVGEVVRLQAGGVAGQVDGTVSSLGLLYTTLQNGADSIMIPNSVVLSAAVIPLREPSAVDVRAELRPGVRPSQVQELLEETIDTPTRSDPHVALEEIEADNVVVRVSATPRDEADGARLADEVLDALARVTMPRPSRRAAAAVASRSE